MVANNTGRAEAGIVAGNFMGVLHSVVTNYKFNQIFLRRMNNTIQRIFARNFESHLRHQGICRRKFEMNCYCKITKGVGNFLTAQFTYSTDWPINMIIQAKYIPASVSRRHLKIKKKGEENEPEGKHLNSQAKQEMDQCQYLSTYNPTCSPSPTTVN